MKLPLLSCIAFLSTAILSVQAQVAAKESPELKNLKSRYQSDVSAAVNPITARYLTSLEALLKSSTQRGDLPAALAIQQEINGLKDTKTVGDEPAHRALRAAVLGTWTWKSSAPDDGSTIQFANDGTGSHGARDNTKWEVTGSRDITITHASKGTAVIHLSPDSQSFKGTSYDGKPVTGHRLK